MWSGVFVPMSPSEQGQVIGPRYLLCKGPHAQKSTSGRKVTQWEGRMHMEHAPVLVPGFSWYGPSTPFGPHPKFVNLPHSISLTSHCVLNWFSKPVDMSTLIWSVGLLSWIAGLEVFRRPLVHQVLFYTIQAIEQPMSFYSCLQMDQIILGGERSQVKYSSMVWIYFLPTWFYHSLYPIYSIYWNVLGNGYNP